MLPLIPTISQQADAALVRFDFSSSAADITAANSRREPGDDLRDNHIIMAKGPPCGRVLDHSLDDRMDYRVRCESGLVIRIRATPKSHVEATRPAAGMSAKP